MHQLVVEDQKSATVPTAKERLFRRRSDAVDPTLTFTGEEKSVAQTLYSQGVYKRGHFDEITKKYLFLQEI